MPSTHLGQLSSLNLGSRATPTEKHVVSRQNCTVRIKLRLGTYEKLDHNRNNHNNDTVERDFREFEVFGDQPFKGLNENLNEANLKTKGLRRAGEDMGRMNFKPTLQS